MIFGVALVRTLTVVVSVATGVSFVNIRLSPTSTSDFYIKLQFHISEISGS